MVIITLSTIALEQLHSQRGFDRRNSARSGRAETRGQRSAAATAKALQVGDGHRVLDLPEVRSRGGFIDVIAKRPIMNKSK